jgi:hypothetical protein
MVHIVAVPLAIDVVDGRFSAGDEPRLTENRRCVIDGIC